jgi:hypothetical protein
MFASLRSQVRAKHLVHLAPTNSSTENLRDGRISELLHRRFLIRRDPDLTDNIALSQKRTHDLSAIFHSYRSPTTRM